MLRSTCRILSVASLAAALCIVPATASRAQTTTAVASQEVTVIEAGAAPRRALRYKLVKGSSESGTMRQKMNMTMEMGGMDLPPQSLPTTVMTMKYTVSDVAADGTAAVAVEFVNVDIEAEGADPMIVNAMRPQLAGMTGITTTYNVSATGQVSNMKVDGGTSEAAQAMQAMGSADQMNVAFPTEPVGVGARWKAVRPVTQSGMTIMQDVEYVLRSLAADSMVLDVVLAQSAKDQVMDASAMPPGTTATLRSMEGKGTSTVVIRFNSAQPSMEMKMDVKMTMDLNMGGEVNTMNQTMVMEIKSAPTPTP